jgi:hypothetical protein
MGPRTLIIILVLGRALTHSPSADWLILDMLVEFRENSEFCGIPDRLGTIIRFDGSPILPCNGSVPSSGSCVSLV